MAPPVLNARRAWSRCRRALREAQQTPPSAPAVAAPWETELRVGPSARCARPWGECLLPIRNRKCPATACLECFGTKRDANNAPWEHTRGSSPTSQPANNAQAGRHPTRQPRAAHPALQALRAAPPPASNAPQAPSPLWQALPRAPPAHRAPTPWQHRQHVSTVRQAPSLQPQSASHAIKATSRQPSAPRAASHAQQAHFRTAQGPPSAQSVQRVRMQTAAPLPSAYPALLVHSTKMPPPAPAALQEPLSPPVGRPPARPARGGHRSLMRNSPPVEPACQEHFSRMRSSQPVKPVPREPTRTCQGRRSVRPARRAHSPTTSQQQRRSAHRAL